MISWVEYSDADELGRVHAGRIRQLVGTAASDEVLIGVPAGRTCLPIFRALAHEARRHPNAGWEKAVFVSLDTYATRTAAGYVDINHQSPASSFSFIQNQLIGPINTSLGKRVLSVTDNVIQIGAGNVDRIDQILNQRGFLDLCLLACGSSDGHVAFNCPGTTRDAPSRIVELPQSTRRDNLRTYPCFESDIARVPRYGSTIGLQQIVDSNMIVMAMIGSEKGSALRKLMSLESFDENWPSSIVFSSSSPVEVAFDSVCAASAAD